MVYSGPQKYPPASTAYWYQDNYPGDRMESNVGVIHTTEGTSLPSYGGGASAPNFTMLPDFANKRLKVYQHFDFDCSSRALVNLSGGVATNTANTVQIELVGTCDPTHRTSLGGMQAGTGYLYWPDAPDWALAELGKFVRWAHDNHGVKLASTVTWKAYPGSYGASNGVRLSGSQWNAYYGWLGHQHVPENSHGDPGDIDFTRVLEHAKGTEDPMALTSDDLKKIAQAVLTTDGIVKVPWGTDTNTYWQLDSILVDDSKRLRRIEAQLAAQSAVIEQMAVALAAHNQQVDADQLVARITAAIESVTVHLDVP